MKAKAYSQPGNHVIWGNGFRSNMPDWPTARVCAQSSSMHYILKRVRTLMLAMDNGSQTDAWTDTLKGVQDVIEQCDGFHTIEWTKDEIKEAITSPNPILKDAVDCMVSVQIPLPPNFPKPPGFK